jgi:hypothetical protein
LHSIETYVDMSRSGVVSNASQLIGMSTIR